MSLSLSLLSSFDTNNVKLPPVEHPFVAPNEKPNSKDIIWKDAFEISNQTSQNIENAIETDSSEILKKLKENYKLMQVLYNKIKEKQKLGFVPNDFFLNLLVMHEEAPKGDDFLKNLAKMYDEQLGKDYALKILELSKKELLETEKFIDNGSSEYKELGLSEIDQKIKNIVYLMGVLDASAFKFAQEIREGDNPQISDTDKKTMGIIGFMTDMYVYDEFKTGFVNDLQKGFISKYDPKFVHFFLKKLESDLVKRLRDLEDIYVKRK